MVIAETKLEAVRTARTLRFGKRRDTGSCDILGQITHIRIFRNWILVYYQL